MHRRTLVALSLALACLGCASTGSEDRPPGTKRVKPMYNLQRGTLEQLLYDRNGDGRVDAWMFLDGTRVARVEADTDGDGVVDRWEYYGADQRLQRVGLSTAGHGTPDRWVIEGPAFCGTARELVREAEAAGVREAMIPIRPAAGADR